MGMHYRILTDHTNRVVICEFSGTHDRKSAKTASIELNEKALELGYNKLYDATKAQTSVSRSESYYFPRELIEMFNSKAYKSLKIAILFSEKSDKDFWTFFKNTAENVGFRIKIFLSKDEALKWLNA